MVRVIGKPAGLGLDHRIDRRRVWLRLYLEVEGVAVVEGVFPPGLGKEPPLPGEAVGERHAQLGVGTCPVFRIAEGLDRR